MNILSSVKYIRLVGGVTAMREKEGPPRYLHTDHLGSLSVLLDTFGYVVAGSQQRYYPFGQTRGGNQPPTLPTDRTFTGQVIDSSTSLMYYSDGKSYGRYYDPALGRFAQADTTVPSLLSQGLNPYSYSYNNPLRFKDPDGHDPQDVVRNVADFGMGVIAQVAYNNTTVVPAYQQNFAPRPWESEAAQAGRVVGDVVSVGQAALEASGGAGLIGGGGVLAIAGAQTGVGVVVGAAGVAVGAGAVVHAGSVATAAGSHAGNQIGVWMSRGSGGTTAGSGKYGITSELGKLDGMSRAELDKFATSQGAQKNVTQGGYTRYKFPDRSELWVRPDGEIIRLPAPIYEGEGQFAARTNKGMRLDAEGNPRTEDNYHDVLERVSD